MARAAARSPWDAVLAEAGTGNTIGQLYWDDRRLLQSIEAFYVSGGLDDGDAVMLVMVPDHQNELLRRMARDPLRIEEPERPGQLAFVDAERLLGEMLAEGVAAPKVFEEQLRARIASAQRRSASGKVRVFDESVDLVRRHDLAAAVRLMEVCRELAAHQPVSILCAYRVAPRADGIQPEFPEELAGLHSHLIPL